MNKDNSQQCQDDAADLPTNLAIIMRGLPGSGKSHWVEQFIAAYPSEVAQQIKRNGYCSTDALFIKQGQYQFNLNLLSEYHQRNLTLFIQALSNRQPVVICDNTNMARWEFMAYDAAAKALGYQVRHVLIGDPADPEHQALCAQRNQHGVSLRQIQLMAKKFESF
ncbi:ATP-binding protein [Shewanella sp. Isolate11]|uniref:ATP-binding protein n=1 Tax=Shewanella sp. Isolate11 TaxID=2908530 RepID=UPI001EFCB749|nr:ATP-binding protein [Shewanella sp. Isolate11]MCG9696918.1 ATP-binding protein [Shewanella sp. Isolate11]